MQPLHHAGILALSLLGSTAIASAALGGTGISTKPVGVQPLVIRGGSDNVLSLPMQRPPVFTGRVVQSNSNTLTVSVEGSEAEVQSPAWGTDRFVYNAANGQRETYCLEITSGALAGVTFRITGNDHSTLRLETEGDDLTNYPNLGAVSPDDQIRIRPYWRIRDVFEIEGIAAIDARPNPFLIRDDILIPDPAGARVGINKAPNLFIHYVAGAGWRAAGQGNVDYGDYVLPPHGVFIVRRRNPQDLTLWNVGPASLVRSVAFVPGGDGVSGNDTYVALSHATAVTLDESGLRSSDANASVIKESASDFARQDELLAFPVAGGFNVSPSVIYYYKTGEGWKKVGASGTVGQSATLEPGMGYIIRKKAANPGVDWLKEAGQ